MVIDTGDPASLVAFAAAIIAAIVAMWQAQKKDAKEAQVQALSLPLGVAANPDVVATLPGRSWKMSDQVLQGMIFDATPENKALIVARVKQAEDQHLTDYRIDFNGGYYLVSYGVQYGSSGNPSGK